MQNEYLNKINCYNLYDPLTYVSNIDVEYNNKLLTTSYNQKDLLLKAENMFNGNSDTLTIEIL